jgi:DNA-binding NtrC family response regulator
MIDTDHTLTSPLATSGKNSSPLLCLTIVWHSDHSRIGEQFAGTTLASNSSESTIDISRFLPLFRKPGAEGLALGHSVISRDSVRIIRDAENGVTIHLPISKMVVELNGKEMLTPCYLNTEQINEGQILGLGRTILLCIHWMHCLPKPNPVAGFIGVGNAAIVARDQIRQVANTDFPVLLLGETGTGKEIAAQAIHALSKRADAPMVTVNMAALNESLAAADLFGAVKGAYTGAQTARKGLFGEASGATLFLDEIGNAPTTVQPMLLRVLEGGDYRPLGAQQDQQSSARIIAATDQNLESESFNQALLRRLESVVIHLPPLRARREDIGILILHLLHSSSLFNNTITLPATLVTELACYHWPGNIRQLAQVLKRVMLALQMGETPSLASLVKTLPKPTTSSATVQVSASAESIRDITEEPAATARKKLTELSDTDVLEALENNAWYIQAAAQTLGISRPSMYKLLEQHPQIRRVEQIPPEEIRHALKTSAGDMEHCASLLKTPSEALRRHLRGLG